VQKISLSQDKHSNYETVFIYYSAEMTNHPIGIQTPTQQSASSDSNTILETLSGIHLQ